MISLLLLVSQHNRNNLIKRIRVQNITQLLLTTLLIILVKNKFLYASVPLILILKLMNQFMGFFILVTLLTDVLKKKLFVRC